MREFGRFYDAILNASLFNLSHITPPIHLVWLEQGATMNLFSRTSDVTVWHSTNNLGCAGGRQRLIDLLIIKENLENDDLVIFLDDDIQFLTSEWIQDFINAMLSWDIVGQEGRIITPDWHTLPVKDGEAVDYVSGGWSGWHGYVLLEGVQFDTRFMYWEDVDMCRQALEKGFTLNAMNAQSLAHESHVSEEKNKRYEQGRQLFIGKWGQK